MLPFPLLPMPYCLLPSPVGKEEGCYCSSGGPACPCYLGGGWGGRIFLFPISSLYMLVYTGLIIKETKSRLKAENGIFGKGMEWIRTDGGRRGKGQG